MIYYTQLVFVSEGREDTFHEFEDAVLPLLQRHGGQLLYRVRPAPGSVLHTTVGEPYEIHLVSFPDRKNFENYCKDPDRLSFTALKESSVARVLLVEGTLI